MTKKTIQEIGEKEFGKAPLEIIQKTVGICNEVYELTYEADSYILRMNKEKEWMFGTHKFLPIFQRLHIKTPSIIAEDYSKTEFPICYQILTKLEGKDLLLVMDEQSPSSLKHIAQEISSIFDKFQSLPKSESFGGMTGLKEEKHDNLLAIIENRKAGVLQRNKDSKVIGEDILNIYEQLINKYKNYFLTFEPKLYYDDMSSKNVMIHQGRFSGLVDLDFLMKGDYLEVIGQIIATWHGHELGEIYIREIITFQQLNEFQQGLVKAYAIFHLIGWTSEEGIRFNSNTSSEINWEKVENKQRKIIALYNSIKA